MAHHRLHAEWAEKYGSIFSLRFLFYPIVVVTDPRLTHRILRSPAVDKWDFIEDPIDAWLGGCNLLTSPTDAQWRAIRKATAPALSPSKLRSGTPAAAAVASRLAEAVADMEEGCTVDVEKLLLVGFLDMIGGFAFEQDLQNVACFHQAVKLGKPNAFSGSLAELLICCTRHVDKNFHVPAWKHRFWRSDVQASRRQYQEWQAIPEQILRRNADSACSQGSFLALLCDAKNALSGGRLPRQRILAEISVLLFAGPDTTSHAAAWTLYLISQHKHVEERLVSELQDLQDKEPELKSGKRLLSFDDLRSLSFLHAVIQEAMRLFPPVAPGQTMITKGHFKLTPELVLPPGILMSMPHCAMFTNSRLWERSQEFFPERWLEPGHGFYIPEDRAATRSSTSITPERGERSSEGDSTGRLKRFVPFGDGPRDCAGKELAKIIFPLLLATLLTQFSFSLAPEMGGAEGVKDVEISTLVTGTKNGMLMRIHKRPFKDQTI